MAKGRGKKTSQKKSSALMAKARQRDDAQMRQYHKDKKDGIGSLIYKR